MLGLIARRLLQLPLILLVIYTLTLALAWAVPGNPLENPEGRRPAPEVQAAMKARYNLDSFGNFYVSYLDQASGLRWARAAMRGDAGTRGAGTRGPEAGNTREDGHEAKDGATFDAMHAAPPTDALARDLRVFDLGPSLHYRDQHVNDIIAASLPVSVAVGALAIVIALALGLSAGVLGAAKPNSVLDHSTLALSLVGISVPTFVVGTLLLYVFSVWLRWFPVGAWSGPTDALLPAFTLSLPFAAYIARLTRLGMIEALASDYVRTARAKGLSETQVLFKHALKNAFLPVLSYLGPATAMAMTGSFVVERVFNVPGLGQHFVNAVQNKDLFLIIGVVLIFSTMLVLLNLAVDVLYRWVDPRIA